MSKFQIVLDEDKSYGKYIVFHREYCNYCKKTFEVLNSKKLPFRSFLIKDSDKEEFLKFMENYNHRTFPAIFLNKNFIGGLDKFEQYIMLS